MNTFTAIHTGETKQGQMDIEITSNSAYIDWSLALLQFQDDVDTPHLRPQNHTSGI